MFGYKLPIRYFLSSGKGSSLSFWHGCKNERHDPDVANASEIIGNMLNLALFGSVAFLLGGDLEK